MIDPVGGGAPIPAHAMLSSAMMAAVHLTTMVTPSLVCAKWLLCVDCATNPMGTFPVPTNIGIRKLICWTPHSSPTATPPPTAPRWSRSTTRSCRPSSTRTRRWPGRADHPRGHRRQEGRRPRPAHASQPHLHLGGRRQGRGRRGVRQRRGHGRGDLLTRACIPARSRPAAASPRSTRQRASSRST